MVVVGSIVVVVVVVVGSGVIVVVVVVVVGSGVVVVVVGSGVVVVGSGVVVVGSGVVVVGSGVVVVGSGVVVGTGVVVVGSEVVVVGSGVAVVVGPGVVEDAGVVTVDGVGGDVVVAGVGCVDGRGEDGADGDSPPPDEGFCVDGETAFSGGAEDGVEAVGGGVFSGVPVDEPCAFDWSSMADSAGVDCAEGTVVLAAAEVRGWSIVVASACGVGRAMLSVAPHPASASMRATLSAAQGLDIRMRPRSTKEIRTVVFRAHSPRKPDISDSRDGVAPG
ncbi:hypothetical protein ACFQH6_12705 [Halobacteriaceae archaeon GCM10025711]